MRRRRKTWKQRERKRKAKRQTDRQTDRQTNTYTTKNTILKHKYNNYNNYYNNNNYYYYYYYYIPFLSSFTFTHIYPFIHLPHFTISTSPHTAP